MSKWHENKWQDKAEAVYEEIKVALQTVYDALNQGQQKKLLKEESVKELFDRYGVEYTQ
jgi:Fe2+ or Zn2+ uptake regulation protein